MEGGDEPRYLVNRLRSCGCSLAALSLETWKKDCSPTTELRRWFHENPKLRWKEFRQRYRKELEACPSAWTPLLKQTRQHTVTLVYAARDPEQNHALILCAFLQEKLMNFTTDSQR